MAAARRIAAAALLGRTQTATALRAGAAQPPVHVRNGGSTPPIAAARRRRGNGNGDRRRLLRNVIDQWEAKQGEHAWLEEVQGERALAFAKQETRRPKQRWRPDERRRVQKILSVLESKEKIPNVSKIGEHYYNFRTSAENPRGVAARRVAGRIPEEGAGLGGGAWTSTSSARRRRVVGLQGLRVVPQCDSENRPIKGSVTRTLISLSPGGSDAIVRREFDLVTKQFVADTPFRLEDPSKSRCSWVDKDTILGADLGQAGDMTSSGYPRRVREWKRGTDRRSTCRLRREDGDVSVGAYVSRSRGHAFSGATARRRSIPPKRWLRRSTVTRRGGVG